MSTQTKPRTAAEGADPEVAACNEVRLRGRVSADPAVRELPSGDLVVEFTLVVARPADHASGQRVDSLECTVWSRRLQRSARAWRAGDIVEVEGAMRRRFFSTGSGRASRVSVEVSAGRRVRRAPVA